MQKRRSHTKSRNGCTNCKQSHVKCDELGPPCANCVAREIPQTCLFNKAPKRPSGNQSSSPHRIIRQSALTIANRNAIEAELMHRYTSSTYKSLCSLPEDEDFLQWDIPRLALKHEFLLQGLYAFVALHIVLVGDPVVEQDLSVYYYLALEYFNKGSRTFREALSSISAESFVYTYPFSNLAIAITLVVPECAQAIGSQESVRILDRMSQLFDLLLGTSSIVITHENILSNGPYAKVVSKATAVLEQGLPSGLNPNYEQALGRLVQMTEEYTPQSFEIGSSSQETLEQKKALYLATIDHLRTCFVEDEKNILKGFAFAFPSLAGPAFAAASKVKEPLALLMLMYWGVLLGPLGDSFWYAKSVGRNIVSEVSEVLLPTPPVAQGGGLWHESILWARQMVGLSGVE